MLKTVDVAVPSERLDETYRCLVRTEDVCVSMTSVAIAIYYKMLWAIAVKLFADYPTKGEMFAYLKDWWFWQQNGQAENEVCSDEEDMELIYSLDLVYVDLADVHFLHYYLQSPNWNVSVRSGFVDGWSDCLDVPNGLNVPVEAGYEVFKKIIPHKTLKAMTKNLAESPFALLHNYEDYESYILVFESKLLTYYDRLSEETKQQHKSICDQIEGLICALGEGLYGGYNTFRKPGHSFFLYCENDVDCAWCVGQTSISPKVILAGYFIDNLILDLDEQVSFLPLKWKRKR